MISIICIFDFWQNKQNLMDISYVLVFNAFMLICDHKKAKNERKAINCFNETYQLGECKTSMKST